MTLSAAVIVTASLLFSLRAVAYSAGVASFNAHASGSAALSAEPTANNLHRLSASVIAGDRDDDNHSGDDEDRDNKNKVTGFITVTPGAGEFVGDWLLIASGKLVTVVVTEKTEVKDFEGVPPEVGDWVEAKGKPREDGALVARRLRPNKFEAGEVVARLTSSEVLTDVVQTYQVTPLDSLLASANIYRFAIGEDRDEEGFVNAIKADTARFMWAEVNYVSEIPSDPEGDPYRTWKWGSNDPRGYINQGALQQIRFMSVENRFTGAGVTVAVIDTGIDGGHPVFRDRLLPGRDLVSDDDVPQDGPEAGGDGGAAVGHGTHVSGIIARLAPGSRILPIRVLNVDGRGNVFILAYAIDWAVEHGADVINLSLGADADSEVLSDAVARAQAQGVVIVAAAGNDNAEAKQYPAAFPGVLSITAVDDRNRKAPFANYGKDWVDLAAPGVGITSTIPVSGSLLYATWSGTSMATPFAAGAAALVIEYAPDNTPAEVAKILVDSGTDLDPYNPQYKGKLGRLLDLGAALPPEVQVEKHLYLPALGK
jgi:subtilisin family serine protease